VVNQVDHKDLLDLPDPRVLRGPPGSSETVTPTKAPVAKEPVAKEPVAKEPVAKEPVAKAPVKKVPIKKKPVTVDA